MKVLAIIVLLATVAYGLPESESEGMPMPMPMPMPMLVPATFLAQGNMFMGELQDTEDGPIMNFESPSMGSMGSMGPEAGLMASGIYGIPSCKLGMKIGMPICIAKCISRGHIAGYCNGSKCTCVG